MEQGDIQLRYNGGIGPFSSELMTVNKKEDCNNMMQYLKTRFVRALVAMATSIQQMSRANFRFVPLQDFSRPWTDADLYAKCGLIEDEIAFIESMIKPME